MDHQHNRRRAGDAVAGGALQNHPPPQPCPRCNSNNTKFCYFNNYSLSQPRFFCKGCRRYWTQGGTLRNVPVGGGCRKSKRPKLTAAAATTTSVSALPLVPPSLPSQQLIMNAHDHQLSSFGGTTTTNNNNASGVTNNTSTGMMMGQHLFATGSSSSGFLSSLPLNFGTNMGLLQGFGGLQNFEQQRQRILQQLQQQQQQEQHHQQQQQQQQQQQNPVQGSLQGVYPIREVGGPSAASAQEWSLGMQPGPSAASETDNSSNTTTTTTNNNISQVHQWPDFMGTSGLDDE